MKTHAANSITIQAGAVIIVVLWFAGSAHAQIECIPVRGDAEVILTSLPEPGGTLAVGTVDYKLGKQVRVAEATISVREVSPPSETGAVHTLSTMFHDFLDGDSLTWEASTILSPSDTEGEFHLNERIQLVDATGVYAGRSGFGVGSGGVSFVEFAAQISAKAWLCE